MGIVVVASAGGSPGATTVALGLALTWPREVVLADCDRHPSQAVLAGYLRGLPAGGRGLMGLAQAYRERDGRGVVLDDQLVLLATDPGTRRRFLPGFTHPRSAVLFEPYWPRLAAQFADLGTQQTDVVVDWGRLDADGLPDALVERARAVLLLTRSSLPALAAVRLALPALTEAVADARAEVQLGVVGGGRPYAAGEISAQLGLPLVADLPWDVPCAGTLSDGAPEPRRLGQRPLWRALTTLSLTLAGRVAVADAVQRGVSAGAR